MEKNSAKQRHLPRGLVALLVLLLASMLIFLPGTTQPTAGSVCNWNYICEPGSGETYLNCPSDCDPPTPTPKYFESMKRAGVCKLVSIADGYLGGTITAIIKGSPTTLKLKADGKTYVLPLVPGSVVYNGDGTYTAQFYTMDPVTGQALVPPGDYTARCHGTDGSNDGGSNNTVTITY